MEEPHEVKTIVTEGDGFQNLPSSDISPSPHSISELMSHYAPHRPMIADIPDSR